MTDVTLQNITSGYNVSKLNTNFTKLAQAVNQEILHTTGGNNVMQQDIDMNGHTLLNIDASFTTENGLATTETVSDAIDAHKLEADPHPQYALDTDVTAAIAAHTAAPDPHPQYLTAAEGLSNPMTASGDLIYGGASGVATRLAKSTDGKVLKLVGGLPAWADETGGGGGGITEAPLDGNAYARQSGGWSVLGTAAKRNVTGTGDVIAAAIAVAKDTTTGAAAMPVGTTAQRPGTPAAGWMRYNTTTSNTEIYTGSAWANVGVPFTGGTLTSALNEAPLTTIASAATTNIGAATSNTVNISGSATITSLGTVASGTKRILIFQGTPVITHNATSLILPSGANITAAVGDTAEFVSLGSGNWKCVDYTRASGQSVIAPTSPITHTAEIALTGTNVDIAIPAGVRSITLAVYRMSMTGGDDPILRLGTSGGIVTSGYLGAGSSSGGSTSSTTSVLLVRSGAAADTYSGNVTLSRIGNTTKWAISSVLYNDGTYRLAGSSVDILDTLTTIRLTSTATSGFDSGSVSLSQMS